MKLRLLLAAGVIFVAGCASRSASSTVTGPSKASTNGAHENLNAVLWTQTALEYEASAVQAYRLASLRLEAAMKDSAWTAALEQTADASARPPAVILDIDETVLDNSYYQARMVRDGTTFSAETWERWCLEARATAIPGAVEFTRDAQTRGVTVFYVTNRTASVEQATRTNLAALGFPLSSTIDAVLTRGERPDWQASSKTARRAHVAGSHRVLLLIGDDLGDFIGDAAGSPGERATRAAPQHEWWGRRWIMLPNPTYGSWERAIVGNSKDPIGAKRQALKVDPGR